MDSVMAPCSWDPIQAGHPQAVEAARDIARHNDAMVRLPFIDDPRECGRLRPGAPMRGQAGTCMPTLMITILSNCVKSPGRHPA